MEKIKSLNFIIFSTLILFFLITFTWGIYPVPVKAADKPPIKVGIVYPISGVMGTIAIPSYKAHLLAMSEINAKGGSLGEGNLSGL